MCIALQHLHEKGFIHRDIKPDNFVWTSNTSTDTMMIDFGLAKRMDEDISSRPLDGFTKHLEFVGPVFFSSPELIAYARDKLHPVDHRSDLFPLGKVIWFLATEDISAGVPSRRKAPAGGVLHALVMNLLQDDPGDTVHSVAAVRDRIRAIEIIHGVAPVPELNRVDVGSSLVAKVAEINCERKQSVRLREQ